MIESRNPATGEVLATFDPHRDAEVDRRLDDAVRAQSKLKTLSVGRRSEQLRSLAEQLGQRRSELAVLATLEMGKPVVQAEQELDKAIATCEWYAGNLAGLISPMPVASTFERSYVRFDPLGVLLSIMPWNFPFWQVLRMLVPALGAGNAVVLKHASNVPQCAMALEEVVAASDFPAGSLRTLLISSSEIERVIADERIVAVALTGSSEVGAIVASQAGSHLKKQVLELGGSDPFIVLDDADLDTAVTEGVRSRNLNAGQTCVAAKRFIVAEELVHGFAKQMAEQTRALVVGDPMDRATDVGPLARADLVDTLVRQVAGSCELGAEVLAGGGPPAHLSGSYFEPTVLAGVTPDMPAFSEETFGPVGAIIPAANEDHAVELANRCIYGLGASVWTADLGRAERVAARLEAGSVYINSRVSSNAALPFGGVKRSGYGRELGVFGIRELTNIKSVAVAAG